MIQDSCPNCGSKFIADLAAEHEFTRSSTERRMHDDWLSRHRACPAYEPPVALMPEPMKEATR